ncbi:MAG: YesL family protein [Clostridia bacterium]|nr:YesL family protein [Clostridia bacterium]
MFGLNYQKPGKGIEKRAENAPRIPIFFEVLFRKLWNFCKINVLYLIVSLPVIAILVAISGVVSVPLTEAIKPALSNVLGDLNSSDQASMISSMVWFDMLVRFVVTVLFIVFLGMGPATAGLTYILRNYAREEHAWIWSDFWRNLWSNFRQSVLVLVIDVLVCLVLGTAIKFYFNMGGAGLILVPITLSVAVVYLMMHLYIYQLMVTFKLSIASLFKNSFAFAVANLPKNLLLLAILAIVHIVVPIVCMMAGKGILIFALLEVLVLIVASGFFTNFFVYPTTEKYIKMVGQNTAAESRE